MFMSVSKKALAGLALGTALTAAGAVSGVAAAPTKAATDNPVQTTATYGNWTVRCRAESPKKEARLCEIVQSVTAKNQGTIANIALGKPTAGANIKIVVQLPIAVSLSKPVTMKVTSKDGWALKYHTCFPAFCMAQADLPTAAIAELKSGKHVTLKFHDRAGRAVNVKAPLKGFSSAFAKMASN